MAAWVARYRDFGIRSGLSFLGLGLLVWLYAIGGVGAGDVKMQMGFGAWVAPIYGWEAGFEIVLWGWIFGVIVGGVISVYHDLVERLLQAKRPRISRISSRTG